MSINFLFETAIALKQRKNLKNFILYILKSENKTAHKIDFIFCSDEYLLKINNEFLKHDYYTDIITFNLTPEGYIGIEAEIYISIDRVKENAQVLQIPLDQEIHRIIFHGILHLCGYRDKTSKEKATMTVKENFYLTAFSRGTF